MKITLSELYFYLTKGCNLACRHCYLPKNYDPKGDKYPILDIETIKKIIFEAKPLGLKGVKLTGGEPFTHPRIIDIIGFINSEKLFLSIETNGLVCSKDIVETISKSEDVFVSVSLDGAKSQTHDWIRGIKGSFDSACNTIRMLCDAGVHPQVIFSVMRKNSNEIYDFIKLNEDLGTKSIKINIVQPTARGKNLHEMNETLSISELIEFGNTLYIEFQPKTKIPLYFDYPIAFRPLSLLSTNMKVCSIHNILGVLPTGEYALCGIGEQIPELTFGVAGRDSLEKIWNEHPVLLKIRSGIPNHLQGICSKCLLKSKCLGACIAQNYYRKHDLTSPFWFCEMAEQQGLFPPSRLL